MSNQLGKNIRVTSFGESHGEGVGVVLDGIPSGLEIDEQAVQNALDLRKPSAAAHSTQRKESDAFQFLSGVFESKTLGSPIAIWIPNEDPKSKDYDKLKDCYRPGHADYTYAHKYSHRDHRGGGRSSIRVFAPLVAAGEICRQLLARTHDIRVDAFVYQVGEKKYDPSLWKKEPKWEANARASKYRMADLQLESEIDAYIEDIKSNGDTLGGAIHASIVGVPLGWGEPIFEKLQAKLAQYLLSINTTKGIEFGKGFEAAAMKGSEHNDVVTAEGFESNNAGGSLGGISTGEEINLNLAFKPISSITREQRMMQKDGSTVKQAIDGRHDVFALPRAVPLVEAMIYLALADLESASRLG